VINLNKNIILIVIIMMMNVTYYLK